MTRTIKFILLFSFLFCFSASAHYYSESFSTWKINNNEISGNFSVLEVESTRILNIEKYRDLAVKENLSEAMVFKKYLEDHVFVLSKNKICPLKKPFEFNLQKEAFVNILMSFQCSSNEDIKIVNNAFFNLIQSHVHIGRVYDGKEILIEKALFFNDQTLEINPEQKELEFNFFKNFYSFLKSGINHILNGFDHLIFIVGLLILISGLRNLLVVITGFTIGHSITLSLAALEIMSPNGILVESIIGFTIMFIGAEYLIKKTNRYLVTNSFLTILITFLLVLNISTKNNFSSILLIGLLIFSLGYFFLHRSINKKNNLLIMITVLFGMIHGLGFGSYLVSTGINSSNIITALLGFNLGVEIGQIIFVLAILSVIWILMQFKLNKIIDLIKNGSFVLVTSMGFFWFIQRLVF